MIAFETVRPSLNRLVVDDAPGIYLCHRLLGEAIAALLQRYGSKRFGF
jgi:hypothetical protein